MKYYDKFFKVVYVKMFIGGLKQEEIYNLDIILYLVI